MKKILFLIFLPAIFFCQDYLSIEDALAMGLENSNKRSVIESNFQIKNLQFENYKKSFLPQVSINTSLPYQRSIQEVLQYDGSVSLLERNFLGPSINFTTKQILPFTGGEISLTNSVGMNKDLENKKTAFSSNWLNLIYSQNINGFNSYKWEKKKYVYSRKIDSITYRKQKIQLKTEVAKIYTDAYLLQIKCSLTKNNIIKAKTLLEQLTIKRDMGRALNIDTDQLQITLAQLSQKLESDKFELGYLLEQLSNHIKLEKKDSLILLPINDNSFEISKQKLKEYFIKTNFENNAQLELVKADEKINKVTKEGAVSLFLQLGIGVNSSSNELNNLFNSPAQRQTVSVGAYIPILNWGILRNNKKIAEIEKDILKKELIQTQNEYLIQSDKLYDYLLSLNTQIGIAEKEVKVQEDVNTQIYELLQYQKRTAYDYKNQLFEYEKSLISYNELLIRRFILYLNFEEILLF